MAEGQIPNPGAGGGEALERAAKRALVDAQRAADITTQARQKLEAERLKLERQVRQMRSRMEAAQTGAGETSGAGRNAAASQRLLAQKEERIAAIDRRLSVEATRRAEVEKTDVVRKQVTERARVVEEGERRATRRTRRSAAPRNVTADPGGALQRYIREAEAEEALEYRRRAQDVMKDQRSMQRLQSLAPPGYSVRDVLQRQIDAPIPKGAGGSLSSAADLRSAAAELGNITRSLPQIGSRLEQLRMEPRIGDASKASTRALEDLKERGLFTPAGAIEPPRPKITYNPAFEREQEQKRKEAAASEEVTRAKRNEAKVIAGNAAEFERVIAASSAGDRDREILEQVRRYQAQVASGQVAPIESADFAREQAAQRRVDRARQDVVRTGTDITRHPELFGGRTAGPFGQVFRRAGVVSEPPAPYAARSPLEALNEQRRQAVLTQEESRRALQRASRSGDADALRDAESVHRANVDRVDGLRREIRQMEADIAGRIANNRAQAAHTQALHDSRRGLVGVNPAMQVGQYLGGGGLVAPGRAAVDPRTALAAYLGGLPDQPYRPGTDIVRHPTEFGRRVPGPFGQVRRTLGIVGAEFMEEGVFAGRRAQGDLSAREEARRRNPPPPPITPEQAAEAERLTRNLDATAAGTAGLNDEQQRLARTLGISGDQMRRHGLLTTEFLQAAAEGRVTVRELGVQLGGTIAKFGGWTAAASLTYGGLAAISAVGQGAIDSSEGVTSLQRIIDNVDTGQAQQQFRDLAAQFNLPVGDVTEAFFQASKAFKDQDSAAAATTASLAAMKIGELDAGQGAQFITAAMRGFNLEATDLMHVVDVANELQNQFGANFRDTAQGVAAAAGTFGAAGGSVEDLSSLVAAGALRTGRSGTEIATALRRTTEIVQRPERRARIIDLLGIDPEDATITEVIERGMQRVSEGADPIPIALAISTPELASGRIVPILQAQELYRGLRDAAGDAAGSAERELGVALSGISERIKEIVVNLSRFGSALAQSGALDSLGLLLLTLNKGLELTTDLLELFNELPRPLRQATLVGAELLGVLALMRRFDVGGVLGGGPGSQLLARRPQQLRRAEVLEGLREDREYVVAERRRALQEANRLTDETARQAQRVVPLRAAADRPDATPEQIRTFNIEAEREQALRARQREADQRAEDYRARQTEIERSQKAFSARTTRRAVGGGLSADDIDKIAVQEGILRASDIGPKPSTARATSTMGEAIDDAVEAQVNQAREVQAVQANTARRINARLLGATAMTAGLARGRQAAARAATSLRNVGAAIVGSIGPLEGILLAALAAYAAVETVKDGLKQQADRLRQIQSAASVEDFDQARQQVEEARDDRGALDRFMQGGSFFLEPAGRTFGFKTPYQEMREAEDAAADAALEEINSLEQANQRGQGFSREQIEKRFKDNLDKGMAPAQALAQASRESDVARGILAAPDAGALERAQRDIRIFKERLDGMTRQALAIAGELSDLTADEFISFLPAEIFQRGVTPRVSRKGRDLLSGLRGELSEAVDFATQDSLIEQIQGINEPIAAELEARLERQLRGTSPSRGRELRNQYVDRIRQLRTKPIVDAIRDNDRRGGELGDRLEDARLPGMAQVGDGGAVEKARERIASLQEAISQNSKGRRNLRAQLRREREQLRDLQAQMDEESFEQMRGLYDARTTVLAGRAGAGMPRLRLQLSRVRTLVQRAIEVYGRNSQEVLALVGEQQQAQAAIIQEQLGLIQARGEFAAAGASTDAGADAIRQGNLSEQLAFQRANPQQFSQADNLRLMTQQRELNKQRRERERQDAVDMLAARYEWLRSLTDNPVEIAKLQEQEAQAVLDRGGFENRGERYRAVAERNNARRNRVNAVVDRRVEDLNFRHDIGKLTDDALIKGLEAEMRGLKRGTEKRRELYQQIQRLKHDAEQQEDFDINVGDIKLPTLYEIRRAVAGRQSGPTVVQRNEVTLHAHGVNDPEQLISRIDDHLGRGGRAAARAAGVR